jgi:transposase
MPRRIAVAAHLSVAELGALYRAATDPVARSHWQIVWLMAQARPVAEVVAVTCYSPVWITQLVKRYNAQGPAGLGDQRHHNPGAPPLLAAEQQTALAAAVDHDPAPEGGLWTGRQVAVWMQQATGRPVHAQRGWEYLRRLGFRRKQPRPRHAHADAAAQAAFGESSPPR